MFVPKAIEEYNARIDKADELFKQFMDFKAANPDYMPEIDIEEIKESKKGNAQGDEAETELVVCDIQEHQAIVALNQAGRIYKATYNSDIVETLNKALFLNIYSIWDAFSGELLEVVYKLKPDLYGKFQKSVPFELIMQAEDIDVIKKKILEDDIENFRRDGYIDQFKNLENRFGFTTLRDFKLWKSFVQCSQTRNVVMHCDGIVSEQFISVCKSVGIKETDLPKVGDKVDLSTGMVLFTSYVMCVTGIMLAHTIWNKLFRKNRQDIDSSLSDICYDLLYDEKWNLAIGVGEFVTEQLVASEDATNKMNIINLAIAYGAMDESELLNKTLKKVDWSLLTLDFRLAEAVLLEKYDEAARLMLKIGPEGDFVKRQAYHEWPLFHRFRDQPEFISAYREVYNESFIPNTTIEIEEIEELADVDETEEILELQDN
ncbi:hypothetical protein L1D54_19390 [Vibrio brasiliensis]|uniref:hypothetical protein n=1 Tax=Vibrio brasiliensis TaxID=170652 RepID=UPI001EFCA5DE|nr:hypothetical protein [Vibrio brasiliensis]MCG9752614.1 hypothetical protein [Vibrio brasiliensis]